MLFGVSFSRLLINHLKKVAFKVLYVKFVGTVWRKMFFLGIELILMFKT
jgi:hypothetical protein